MEQKKIYSVGTLVYTRAGLIGLFSWLLWGDFIYSLMETVMPGILPLLLKHHAATNTQISMITGSISMALCTFMNPIISYRSDRYRSRWGRRRPFILLTTPFVVVFLAAIPFAPEILKYVEPLPVFRTVLAHSPVPTVILTFGVLVVGFQAFNMFVASVYYYLIPDVVPDQFIGRFYGMFRVFGGAANMAFMYFLYGKAETHAREIFVGIAVLYGIVITLMCWRVKEGTYPPPPVAEEHGHWWSGIRNYWNECFSQWRFWLIFLGYSCIIWSNCSNVFRVFFYRDELGLSLDVQGKVNSVSGLFGLLICYPLGMLADRWGGGRTLMIGYAAYGLTALVSFFAIQGLWSMAIWATAVGVSSMMIYAGLQKWIVEVYPREQYGQFCSAGALFSSVGAIVLNWGCAKIIDIFKVYRSIWLWIAVFGIIGFVATYAAERMARSQRTLDLTEAVP